MECKECKFKLEDNPRNTMIGLCDECFVEKEFDLFERENVEVHKIKFEDGTENHILIKGIHPKLIVVGTDGAYDDGNLKISNVKDGDFNPIKIEIKRLQKLGKKGIEEAIAEKSLQDERDEAELDDLRY